MPDKISCLVTHWVRVLGGYNTAKGLSRRVLGKGKLLIKQFNSKVDSLLFQLCSVPLFLQEDLIAMVELISRGMDSYHDMQTNLNAEYRMYPGHNNVRTRSS